MELHQLPAIHSIEAEKSVLGAMLSDPSDTFDLVAAELKEADFFHPAHQTLFRAFLDMKEKGKAIDPSTVFQYLEDRGLSDSIGGASFLGELSAGVINVLTAPTQIATVRDKAILRNLQKAAVSIAMDCHDAQGEAREALGRAETAIMTIGDRRASVTLQEARQIVNATYQEIMDIAEGTSSPRLQVGWPEVDSKTGGFDPGAMVVIAARPSVGKTALALNWADSMLRGGTAVGFISLEMRLEQLAMRLMAARTDIPLRRIREGNLNNHQSDVLAAAGDKLSAEPWSMVYEPGASISAVRSHIRRMVKRTGAKAVFVDYIGLITAPEKENRLQEVSHVSRQLKQIAGEMGIVLFPLCQLNRNVEDKEPALHHLKESGQIEQDADAVALIHRAWIKEGDMALEGWVKLAKVRDGQTGRIDVVYNGPVTTFKPKGI